MSRVSLSKFEVCQGITLEDLARWCGEYGYRVTAPVAALKEHGAAFFGRPNEATRFVMLGETLVWNGKDIMVVAKASSASAQSE